MDASRNIGGQDFGRQFQARRLVILCSSVPCREHPVFMKYNRPHIMLNHGGTVSDGYDDEGDIVYIDHP